METQMFTLDSVILVAIFGALVSLVSFLYRSRQSNKEKYNHSLFNLLFVWADMVMKSSLYSEKFTDQILESLERVLPVESISEEEKLIIVNTMRNNPSFGGEGMYRKYMDSVEDLAKLDPVLAFSLSSNQFLVEHLRKIEDYETGNDETALAFLSGMREFNYKESLEQLEKDLIDLSSLCSRKTSKAIRQRIKQVKEKSSVLPKELIDKNLHEMLSTGMAAMQKESESKTTEV